MKKVYFLLLTVLFAALTTKAQVAGYGFAQSAGTYTAISGGTILSAVGFANDDDTYSGVPIGFNFVYNGTTYTTLGVNSNGYMAFGGTAPANYYNGTSIQNVTNAMHAFSEDLQGGAALCEIEYLVTGAVGSRVFTIQWKNWGFYNVTTTGNEIQFQAKLYETTNVIQFVYLGTPLTTQTCQVGLTGATVADFISRTTTTNWAATTASGVNTAQLTWSVAVFPASGQTYTFSPPPPCAGSPSGGTTLAATNPVCSGSTTVLSLSGATTGVTGLTYQWQSSPDNIAPYTNIVGATSATYTATVTANTYYRCVVTCSNGGGFGNSIPVQVTLSLPAVPTAQATALVLTPTSTSSISGSFTAAAGAPSGYLTVRTTTAAPPTSPVDGTTYTAGATALGGVIVQSSAATSFVSSGLAPSTTYYYWTYSYNTNACAGARTYLATSPLSASQVTLACTPLAAGTYTVGPTGTYASLTAALVVLAGGTTGNVILELQPTYLSAVETFPVTFIDNVCQIGTITVRPQTGAVGLSITSASTTGTINFNGGDFVIFDGRAGGVGVSQLTISNTATAGYAIQYINSATNNTIKYCTVSGVNTGTTNGVIAFSTAVGFTDGNSFNTIDNCDIRDAATTPTNLIYCSGTATSFAIQNNSNTISNSTLHDWFNASSTTSGAAINIVAGASDWTITGNSFYQTVSRIFTMVSATDQGAIFIASTANNSANFTITNNFIGGTAPLAGGTPLTWSGTGTTGTPTPRMVRVSTAAAAFNNITGNTFANMAFVSASTSTAHGLLAVLNGNTNISNNTFGSQTATGNITWLLNGASTTPFFLPISVGTGATISTFNITTNNIGGITTSAATTGAVSFRVIYAQPVAGSTLNISGNFIGGTVANSIQQLTGTATAGVGSLFGVLILNPTVGDVISNNTIRNLTITTTFAGPSLTGINVQANGGGHIITGNTIFNLTTNGLNVAINNAASIVAITMTGSLVGGGNISGNTIYNLTNTNTTVAGWINGMYFGTALAPQPNTLISKNFIHSISLGSATGGMAGIFFPNTGNAMISNNMIRLGVDASGASITTPLQINGIYKPSTGFAGVYFNTVYIGGSGVTGGAVNTFAYRRSANILANTDSVMNNIFWNARSNGAGTGKHYAITLNSTTAILENNNDLFANGTGGFVGNINLVTDYSTLALWKAATNLDFASISADPQLLTPNGTSATVDLHINVANPTPIEQAGLNIPGVIDDFDGQSRAALSPVDIGADAGNFILLDLSGPVISYTPLSSTCATGDRLLTPVTITDATGIPLAGGNRPRIYYRKNAGPYFSQPGTFLSGVATNSQWSFNIVATDMGGLVATDVVTYYIIAQDIVATPNVSSNPGGVVATDVNAVPTSFPPAPNTYTILATSLSGTYTVGGAGVYPTLTAAVAAYNTSCLTGPVVFSLLDATYPAETYPITINANSNASAVNTLTIRPAAGNPAVISGSDPNALIKWNGADWVTIDGINSGGSSLRITNTNATGLTVLWIASASTTDGATNNAIKNCTVAGISSAGSVGAIIGSSGAVLGNPADAPNSNNTILGNTLTTAQNGIYISGFLGSYDQNWVIDQNIIGSAVVADKMSYRGVSVQNVNNVTISNNTINGVVTATTATTTGITTFNGVTNCNIFNNKVSDIKNTNATGFGTNGISMQGTIVGANINVYNNFISDVAGNGFGGTAVGDNGYGIIITGGSGFNLYFNTIVMNTNQVSATGLPSALNVTSAVTLSNALNVRNNIFVNTQTVGAQRYCVFSGAPATVYGDINYNDYYFTGPNLGNIAATLRPTLAAWQTGTGKDANSIAVQPIFVSATDLHLSNAAGVNWCLNGTGQTIATYTTDIDGQTRGTPPDIGADEFVATSLAAATPAAQTICSGSAITTIVLSGGTTYTWTRDNVVTVTGIAASGSGDVSGSLTNTTTAPVTVTFTFTALDAAGCTGPATFTATVLVNPTPNAVATPSSQTVCSGVAITTIALSGSVAGTTYAWTRDNTVTVTGIAANGSGNISGTLTNTTAAPITVTFTITPTSGACPGTPITATVTVNPTPDVAQPADQSVCNNTATAAVIFTGAVAGTTFNWTNNTPSIGLAASGSGNIPSFTATNATAAPVTATITVTPVTTNSVSTTFNYTGAMQTWTVPAGVTSINIQAFGAQGGSGAVGGSGALGGTGGLGASATGTLAVVPGQVLNIFVGGAGGTPTGGFNGGGDGGSQNAGGGGGASDVRVAGITAVNRVITAGGGGGGGRGGCIEIGGGLIPGIGGVGGIGGGGVGSSGGNSTQTGFGPAGGGFPGNTGSIQGAFGPKGIGCGGFSGSDGSATATEVGGIGGGGQNCCCSAGNSIVGGGGGGGGQIGGGGGGGGSAGTIACQGNSKGAGGGGGGGSNYTGGVTSGSSTNGVQTGNGMVIITYALGPSCPGTPKTFTITVKPTPIAVATPASQAICSGQTITTIVNTSTTSGTTFAWTRDNTVNVTGIAASGTGDISGTLTSSTGVTELVTFTITPTANGCPGAPITATVTVNALPAFTNTNVEPTTCVSADGSITLNMTGPGGPYTFAWTGVGVNPTSQNQTGLTVGIYNVTVTVTATGCQSSATYTLLGPGGCFVCPTIPVMTSAPSGSACTGGNVTLQTTGMTNMGITYGITFKYYAAPTATPYVGGTTIATVANGALTGGGSTATTVTSFATAGTYYIYAILSPIPVDPACRPSNVVVLTVNNTPTLTLGTSPTVCAGSTTASLPFTSTYTGPNGNLIVNGGFETGGSAPWVVLSAVPAPTISGASPNTGSFSWALGRYSGSGAGDCSVYQTITVPAEGGTLSYWYKPTSADAISDDWQDAYITNTSGTVLATIMHVASNSNAWTNVTFNMAAFAGQTVRVMFLVHNDADANITNMYLDDVSLNGPGGSPATYSITWSAAALGQGFTNVVNAPLPSNPTPITLVVPTAAAPATYTGSITITNASGCSTAPQTFSVTINPSPVVNVPGNQVLCNGATTTAVNFTTPTTGPGTIVYDWVHTGSGIGLGPNGTGNIPAFTAVNTGNTPAVGTITVTATYTFNGVSCTGAPVSFTITVNPTPTVNAVANQTVCHNTATTAVTFTGAVAGTVYTWTNNNATIGLAASGTGNIASFTATNAGTAPVVATIVVTPSYTNAGVTCTGATTSFTITVNPRPIVNAVGNQTVCNNTPTAAVNFTSTTAGTTYAWTNSNTAIGLAAAGTGNIPSFIATNTTALPISATITVTPSFAGCAGTAITFTITVNASPSVDPVPNQLLCNGSFTAPLVFNGPVSGAFYTWTNNQPSIGLASVGAGNVPPFIATNTGTTPVIATVVVTGSFTTGGVTCTGPSRTFTITVNPTPSVNAIANQTLCNGATSAAVTIAGPVPGTLFSWTNNNTSIGLAAGGTGNIGSFIAINNSNAPVTATITITSDASSGGLNCPGIPVTFTITVNPTPTVVAVSSQTLCSGSATTAVNFTGAVAGTTFNWTNSNTAIGLGASGTGNIPSFTATNATAAPISGTITVTPVFAGCTGTSVSFTITVNPTAFVNQPTNQTLCHGASTAAINFTGTPVGVTFSWTNNNTTIGLVAAGTGNIPSFVATNSTQAPVTATITVTPSIAGALCTGSSKTFTITVNPLTNITFTNAPPRVCLTDTTVILTATPAGGVWSGPGVVGNTFSASLAGVGVKTLTYTTTSGCGTSATVNITVNDCIDRHNTFATSIRLYPNPSNGQFYIRFLSDLYKEFNVRIIDNDGRQLRNFRFTGLLYGSVIPINLRELPSDTYILQVYNAQEKANFRFVIVH